jgi:hypothetical protein
VAKRVIRLSHFSTSFRPGRAETALLFIDIGNGSQAGFEPATDIGNVMGASGCLHFS